MGNDFMLAVAVHTEGGIGVTLKSGDSMNAFLIFKKNLFMAASTGCRLPGHQMGFTDSLNVMDTMTICTNGRKGGHTFSEKSAPMNGLFVFLIGSFPMNVIFNYDSHIFMTDRTRARYIQTIDRRLGMAGRQDVMFAMAIPAAGYISFTPFQISPAMNTVPIAQGRRWPVRLGWLAMTGGRAIRRRQFLFMRDRPFF